MPVSMKTRNLALENVDKKFAMLDGRKEFLSPGHQARGKNLYRTSFSD